jgi:uncharacterized protein
MTAVAVTTVKSDQVIPGTDNKKKALFDLKELFDAGVLSKEEFNTEKAKILNN